MEPAKREVHEAGLNLERLAAVRDADDARGVDHGHTETEIHSGAQAAGREVKNEEVLKGVQAESQDHVSAALGSVFDNDTSNDDTHKNRIEDQDDSATLSAEMNSSLQKHQDCPFANSGASITWQDQSPIATKSSLQQPDSTYAGTETSDLSQRQSHSSDSSSGSSTSSDDCACPMPKHSKSAEVRQGGSVSALKTDDSTLDLHLSSDPKSTVMICQDSLEGEHELDNNSSNKVIDSDSKNASGDVGIQEVYDVEPAKDAPDEFHITANVWREWETPPLTLNYEALRHIASTCLAHGNCVNITTLRRGGFHEIRVLHFEDGWSCIARFTRDYDVLHKAESELATIEYVRKHTSIPVPRIYLVNHNENHVVGAQFVLMERMKGQPLCKVWAGLTLEHKLNVINQLAHVLGQLAELKFHAIGSLRAGGYLGPLLNMTERSDAMHDEPFNSTMEYFFAFLRDENPRRTLAARKHYVDIRSELETFFEKNTSNPTLDAPYRLIHNDLDSQNIMVLQEDKSLPPKISGIIDWDWSYVGPLYYLCEYPHDICDWDDSPQNYADNKVLRKHFVATLIEHFPENSEERKHIKQCFREKSFTLNTFQSTFLTRTWPESLEGRLTEQYLKKIRGGCYVWETLPYSGRFDWERDSDLTDSDLEDSQSQGNDEMSCEGSDEGFDAGSDSESSIGSVEQADGPSSDDEPSQA